ncbi:MAG: lysophospholipid acyltransferase family protein [Phycisphaerales bacterium]|nr:lysophospholipid acyltransferase family protein [Phycisphaerales bacterium]
MKGSAPTDVIARLGLAERLLVDGFLCPGYRIAPGMLRSLRPLLVRLIWASAPDIRRSLRRNARILLPPGNDEEDRRQFGLEVLCEIQQFTEELVRASSRDEIEDEADINSIGNIQQYFARRERGGGIVIATAHMGSFEVAASVLVQMEKKVHVVYARDPSKSIERMRSKLRRDLGVIEHAVDDGIETWRALQEALERDEAVALPADRVQPGQVGFDCELLGHKTRLPSGPFKLAMTTGSPLVPAFCWRNHDDEYRITVEAPIEFDGEYCRNLTEHPGVRNFVEAFETALRNNPTQWLMVFDAWPESLERTDS